MNSNKLLKHEDPAGYASRANEGVLLGYPVSINGKESREDNGIPYHASIKYFDKNRDHPHAIHNLAQHLPLNPPDAKNTQIKFDQFKARDNTDVFAITLHGNSAEKLKEHNGKFAGMGFPSKMEWQPHISVDQKTWQELKDKNPKTAQEAGINFGPAQLRQGPTVLHTYHHEPDSAEPKFPDLGDMTAKIDVNKAENVLGQKPLMKPYVSEAQRRWAHTSSGKEALGGNAGVHEWDEATKGKHLPEKVAKSEESTTHKSKLSQPHFLLSAENPRHPKENKLGLTHQQALSHLKSKGYDAHEVQGHYGSPEKSILVHNVSPEHAEKLHGMASQMGQDSSIYSTGKDHEMRFHHGENKGKSHYGSGTVWHKEKPKDLYTTLPGNEGHFTHNFNFESLHPSHGLGKSVELHKSEPTEDPSIVHLVHFSPHPNLGVIDPKFMGTGVDSRTKGRDTWRPHSFYYTHGTEPEEVVTNQGKNKYHVMLDTKKSPIYDIGSDPHGLVRQSIQENNGAQNMDDVHEKIKAAGYGGFHNSNHPTLSGVVAMYHALPVHSKEMIKSEIPLEKGALKTAGMALGMAGALAGSAQAAHHVSSAGNRSPASIRQPKEVAPSYDHNKMLQALAQVESSGGINVRHGEGGGPIHGHEHAYGVWGEMPETIRETIKGHPDLRAKHGKALALQGHQLHRYMKDHPELEKIIADRHLSHMEHVLGKDPGILGYGWLMGNQGTLNDRRNGVDIKNHWRTKRVLDAYNKVK